MGAEFDSTSQLVYGVRLYAASLYFAAKASFELGDPLHAIRLVRFRKSSRTLDANGGSVERVPVEVWDIVQREVKELASQLMKEEETALLVDSMCPKCTSLMGKPHELPSWSKYWSLEEGDGYGGYCGCFKRRRAAMCTIFRMNLTPFLKKYGLAIKAWRNRLTRHEDEESDADEGSEYSYPSDSDGESGDDDEPDPQMEVLLVPAYEPHVPPPAAVVHSWCHRYDAAHNTFSNTIDLDAASRVWQSYEGSFRLFFEDWAVELPEPQWRGRPGLIIHAKGRAYE